MVAHHGIFDNILTSGVRSGQVPARTQKARDWYRDTAKHYGHTIRKGGKEAGRKDYARINERKLLQANEDRMTTTIKPGNMYMYLYDPKYKEELPFYDRFPLVFPFHVESDRFWGINLHYLPLGLRAKLMDALYDLANNRSYDETTKLKMSYQILKSASKYRYFKPCVKQYLKSHLKSQFMYIYPSEWDIALFLPTEKFTKASKTQVWADSKKKLGAM